MASISYQFPPLTVTMHYFLEYELHVVHYPLLTIIQRMHLESLRGIFFKQQKEFDHSLVVGCLLKSNTPMMFWMYPLSGFAQSLVPFMVMNLESHMKRGQLPFCCLGLKTPTVQGLLMWV